jgi:hypothetical protein
VATVATAPSRGDDEQILVVDGSQRRRSIRNIRGIVTRSQAPIVGDVFTREV